MRVVLVFSIKILDFYEKNTTQRNVRGASTALQHEMWALRLNTPSASIQEGSYTLAGLLTDVCARSHSKLMSSERERTGCHFSV